MLKKDSWRVFERNKKLTKILDQLEKVVLKRAFKNFDKTGGTKHVIFTALSYPTFLREIHNGICGSHLGTKKTQDKVKTLTG